MKVFFTTTPRLKKEMPEVVPLVYKALDKLGHTLTSDYLKTVDVDDFYRLDNKKTPIYYEEILEALKKADVVVFEASLHSIGVGLLIKEALELGKGVIVLHLKGKTPFFLSGIKDDRFVINEYTLDTLGEVLSSSFDYLSGRTDVRFNFFISPSIGRYLDWVSKHKRVPRAVFLRRLIEEQMQQDKEFSDE